MATEQEKRLHRCCFSGHRPEKLDVDPEAVKQWLSAQIDAAIAAGYRDAYHPAYRVLHKDYNGLSSAVLEQHRRTSISKKEVFTDEILND